MRQVALQFLALHTNFKQTTHLWAPIIHTSLTICGFDNLEKHRAGLEVPDLEPGEVDVVHVGIGTAKIIWENTVR